MKLTSKLLPRMLSVRALSPAARTDLLIAAIPFALALAAKGLEALERHIAGRLVHLTELEIAIAELGEQLAAGDVRPKPDGPEPMPGDEYEAGAVVAHPAGCMLAAPHAGECVFRKPDKVSVDDDRPDVPTCTDPSCIALGLHEHVGGDGPVVGTTRDVTAAAL